MIPVCNTKPVRNSNGDFTGELAGGGYDENDRAVDCSGVLALSDTHSAAYS